MAKILLTSVCNRACRFCFAREEVACASSGGSAWSQEAFMSLDNVKKVIDFHRCSGLPAISLLGGEPTIHPEFPRIVDMCVEAGLSIRLFTGGVVPGPAKDRLRSLPEHCLSIIVNISAKEHCRSAREYEATVETLRDLASCAAVGYTLFTMDVDPDWLTALVLETGCRRSIRLGLAMPGPTDATCLLPPSRYRDTAKWILRLASSCDAHDIGMGFDCGFTMCMFTPEELGKLAYLGCKTRFICRPIIDVGTDLSAWSCFATSTLDRTHLAQYGQREDLVRFFTDRRRAYRQFGVHDRCHTCKHKRRGICDGGCLAYVVRSFSGVHKHVTDRKPPAATTDLGGRTEESTHRTSN